MAWLKVCCRTSTQEDSNIRVCRIMIWMTWPEAITYFGGTHLAELAIQNCEVELVGGQKHFLVVAAIS